MFESFCYTAGIQKSFYGKAKINIEKEKGITQLKSYNTIVATFDHVLLKATVFGWYSLTTQNHVNAFLKYHGLDFMTKKEMIKTKQKIVTIL